jgi:hypothetical protein
VNVKFFVEFAHKMLIDEDEDDEYIHRTLLRKPETQWITTQAKAVESISEQDATTK